MGCSAAEVEGQQQILDAREKFAQLRSGELDVVNDQTGETEQTFIFRYDEVGVLSYSLCGVSEDGEYFTFSNGYETYEIENGEYSYCRKGDPQFQMFTYDVRHPMTYEEFIFFDRSAADKSSVSEENGETVCRVEYDPALIAGDGLPREVTEFSVTYRLKDGILTAVTEQGKSGSQEYSYTIYVRRADNVEKVEMPPEIQVAATENP